MLENTFGDFESQNQTDQSDKAIVNPFVTIPEGEE